MQAITQGPRQGRTELRTYRTDHRNPQRLRYGWRLTRSGHIVVDSRQRASIFVMLALRTQCATLQQICDHLSELESPTPRKGRWHCSTVKKIIDQNQPLLSLLPRALPGCGRPPSAVFPCTTKEADEPAHALAEQARARPPATRAVYAPSQGHRTGALVHKSATEPLVRS